MEQDQQIREITEISPDPRVRVFRRTFDTLEVDAYAITGTHTVVLLDTLLCPADMAEVTRALTSELGGKHVLCVNSHADWDHAWGNCYFSACNIPILAHERCRTRLNSQEARQGLEEYQAHHPQVFRDVQLAPPTLTFREQLTIHTGDLSVELLHAPGHCQDQVVAWLPELRLLLAFDAIEKPLPCIGDAACAPLMFTTLERLAALNAQSALCSHGNTNDPALIGENLAYLREIERRARLHLEQHTPGVADLEHAAAWIGYPFDEVLASSTAEVDRTYYAWAHEQNARAILRWLQTQKT